MPCGNLSTVLNANMTGVNPNNFVYMDEYNYTCNPGFMPSGNVNVTCQSDGTWTAGPTCESGK